MKNQLKTLFWECLRCPLRQSVEYKDGIIQSKTKLDPIVWTTEERSNMERHEGDLFKADVSAFSNVLYCKILCPEVESEAVSQKQPVAPVTCELCLTLSRHAENYGQGERGMWPCKKMKRAEVWLTASSACQLVFIEEPPILIQENETGGRTNKIYGNAVP